MCIRDSLYCVGWGVKLYSVSPPLLPLSTPFPVLCLAVYSPSFLPCPIPTPGIQLGSLGRAVSSPAGPGRPRPPNTFCVFLCWNQRTCCNLHNDTFIIFIVRFGWLCPLGRIGAYPPQVFGRWSRHLCCLYERHQPSTAIHCWQQDACRNDVFASVLCLFLSKHRNFV